MKRFSCECGNVLYFGSSRCLACGREVGYDPAGRSVVPVGDRGELKVCENGRKHQVCNWLLPRHAKSVWCIACGMNRTIPDLGNGRNRMLWGHMETAKKRLLYTLTGLGFSLPSKSEDPRNGLAFDILSARSNPNVTTGHLNGVITVNLEEADDTYRQINRQQLGENSRTLLGHFRHESAHYLWQRHLSALDWESPPRLAFRERFGDEWLDYATALETHYQRGPVVGWEQRFITAYASSHPWEDWAETWAHYLQIVDGLETCESMGIQVKHLSLPLEILPPEAGVLPDSLKPPPAADGEFLLMLQRWMCLSTVLNEVSGSLGGQPFYPYVISVEISRKLRLAHHFAFLWGKATPPV